MIRASSAALALAALFVAGAPGASHAVGCIDPATAAAQFRAAAGTQHSGFDETCSGALPVNASWATSVGFSHSEMNAEIQSPGQVLIENYSLNNAFGWPYGEFHFMDGSFYLPDLIITGGPATSLTTALNVSYGGEWLQLDCGAASCPDTVSGTWSASVHRVSDGTLLAESIQGFDYIVGAAPEVAQATLTGVPVGSAFGLQLSVRVFNMPVNPVTSLRHAGFFEFLASSVFDLPEGYTVDSASGNISSNTWSAVPEPELVLLLAVAAGLLVLRARVVQ